MNIFSSITINLFLLISIVHNVYSLSCKDESGLDTQSWTILKMPKGTDYYYYENNEFIYSYYSLNDTTNGALTYTVKQLWDNNTNYIIYNDESPNQIDYNFSVAHSKGIWMWDSQSAVLITHSIPKFPQGPKEISTYVGLMGNAWEYGQSLVCINISTNSLSNSLHSIYLTNPYIYDSSQLIEWNNISIKTDNIPCSVYIIDNKYTLFTKSSNSYVDIWASCIAIYFSSEIAVESWVHGEMDGPYCSPNYTYSTVDIQSLSFPMGQVFTEYDDHSKWGILENSIVCFGDLNRVVSQKERSGSVYCWENESLWNQLNKFIQNKNMC